MGYLVSKQSKAQLVSEIKKDSPNVTEWSLVGNHLWGLFTVNTENDKVKVGDKVIVLYLIQSFGKGEYGYKVMDESSHPYYYTCPLKFLKQSVVLCQEWRDCVVKYHADKTATKNKMKSIMVGDVLPLRNTTIPYVNIVSVEPLRGVYKGVTYRISNRHIA